jgi:hypothetical protein
MPFVMKTECALGQNDTCIYYLITTFELPCKPRCLNIESIYKLLRYRKKLTREDVIEEIEKNKGTQFDPEIADILLNLIKNGDIEGI